MDTTTTNRVPATGYILALWDNKNAYRATAAAYLERTGLKVVENKDGIFYTLQELREAMIGGVKISYKKYKCTVCGHEEEIQTNHYGDVYSACKDCGDSSSMACNEPEAIEYRKHRPQTTAIMVCYYYDLEIDAQRHQYEELVEELKKYGYGSPSPTRYNYHGKGHKHSVCRLGHHLQPVTIYDPNQFYRQYVTDKGRLYPWAEYEFPNKRLAQGYFLLRELDESALKYINFLTAERFTEEQLIDAGHASLIAENKGKSQYFVKDWFYADRDDNARYSDWTGPYTSKERALMAGNVSRVLSYLSMIDKGFLHTSNSSERV